MPETFKFLQGNLSVTEFAAVLGITPRRVNQLAAEGVFKPTERGVYPVTAITKYCANLRESTFKQEPGETVGLTEQRARLTHSKADLAMMQVAKLKGELVSLAVVKQTWIAVIIMVRARLLAMPTKLAPRLLGKKNAAEVETILRAEVYEACEDLSDNVEIRKSDTDDSSGNAPDSTRSAWDVPPAADIDNSAME